MHRTIYFFALLILGVATPWVAAQPPGANFGNPRGGFQGGGRAATSTETGALPAAWANSLKWRNIGPANMSGRITSIAVYEKEPSTWWASSASGGLLKTTDNGITFEFQFDREATVSVGDVQVFQGDPNIVWVGTGEANPRNSASWGDGVYKSTDGGKTWKNMGLNKTAHTGRIALHPTNPDIAYVGALGRLWGSNEDRGLFKTVDGGKTWEKVFYLDADTGIIDVQMNPANPETLIVAAYQRRRDGFDGNDPAVKFGANAGIYRTVDGGKTFERLKQGLPTVKMGRVGLNYYRKDPNFVYAIIETEKIGNWPKDSSYSGIRGEDADAGAKLLEVTKDGPAAKAGLEVGDIILRVDDEAVLSYSKLIEFLRRKPAGTKVKLEISRNREPKSLELELGRRPEVEALEKRIKEAKEPLTEDQIREGSPFAQSLGGQNPNMHDEQGAEGFEMGGVYRSADGGTTWQRINSVNPRPMYYSQIRVDPSDNNHLWVLGTELYRSKDGGETFTPDGHGSDVHVDHHSMWIDPRDGKHVILGNDGGIYVTYSRGEHWDHHNHVAIGQFYHVGVASDRDYYVYGGLQDNGSWGGPSVVRNNPGPVNGDWMNIGGGDGFICLVDPTDPNQLYSESQNGAMGRLNLATGERGSIRPRPPQGKEYRFNWKTPFILSNHNPEIFYAAGNHVFRSLRKGNEIKEISPQITVDKQGTGSAIAESPVDERFLIVGTTDGQLWSTRDFGQTWVDLWNSPEKLLSSEDSRRQGGAPGGQGGGPGGQGGGMGPGGPGSGRGFRGGPGGPGGGFRGRRGQGDPAAPGDPAAATPPANPAQEAPAQDPPGTVRVTMPEQAAPPAPAAEATPAAPAKDDGSAKVVGSWQGGFTSDMLPPQRSRFQLTVSKNAEGKLEGTFRSSQSDGNLQSISFDAATGQLEAGIATGGAEMKLSGKVDGEKLTGQMSINSGAFVIPFAADRASATAAPAPEASTADASSDGSKPLKELLPKQLWISSLECSRVVAGRAYVTVDGHRSDDYLPYVFVTENYGRTWKSIRSNLPDDTGTAWVLREDLKSPNILYLGTEMGAWVSIDRGANWTKMNSNLPTVAVHELAQHPTSGEVVAATHGRSLWIADISSLRQFTPEKVKSGNHLYAPNELIRWRRMPEAGSSGTRRFVGENPASDVKIHYSLGEQAQSVQIEVKDIQGRRVAILTGAAQSGLQTVSWDTRRILAPVAEATATTPGRGFGGGGFGGRFGGGRVGSGTYQVGLIIDGEVVATQPLVISEDPDYQGPEQRTSTELEMFEALFSSVEEEESSSSEEESKDQ